MLVKKVVTFCFIVFIFSSLNHTGEIFSNDDTRVFFSGRIAMVTADNENGDITIRDNSSRFRFDVHKILDEDTRIFATSEYALMTNASDSDELFKNRLGYVGISGDFGRISVGRVWSAAYNVTSWTDFDEFYGNDTLGVYSYGNANLKGTIRTTSTIKYENNNFYGFTIAVQYSGPLKNNISVGFEEDTITKLNRKSSIAGSIIYNVNKFVAIGYSYSSADIEVKGYESTSTHLSEINPENNLDTTQHVVGFIYNKERTRFSSILGYSENMVYAGYKNFSSEFHFSYNYDKDPANHSIMSINTFYSVHNNFKTTDYAFIAFTITKALNKDVYVYSEVSYSFRKKDSISDSLINPPKNRLLLGFRFSW